MGKKKRQFPHTYVIIFALILLGALLTWLVPGGAFDREEVVVNGIPRSVVVADSYHEVPRTGQSWQVITALFEGMLRTADIIFYILIIGGAFWMLNESRALDVAIAGFLKSARRVERVRAIRWLGVDNIIVTLIMLCFSFFGAVIGMSEETIAFVVIFVPMAVSMGYDSIVGISMCFLAAGLGFAGALLNPFTIGIAQGLAGVQLFSGLEYRLAIWLVVNVIGIAYVLRYMAKLRKNPRSSPVYEEDAEWRSRVEAAGSLPAKKAGRGAWVSFTAALVALTLAAVAHPLSTLQIGQGEVTLPALPILAAAWLLLGWRALRHSVQLLNVTTLLFTIMLLVVGVMGYGWYIKEIASLFLTMGLLSSVAFGKRPNEIVKSFTAGAADILSAALVVGFASGIVVVLEQGQIIDTLLNGSASAMVGLGPLASVAVMYLFYTLLNLIIASGSAKAALTVPIMSQFSDLVGVSRQTMITAYQLGGGFTNLATPTSGVMVGVLSMAKIPYVKWLRWFWPLLVILIIVGFLLLIPTVYFPLHGF